MSRFFLVTMMLLSCSVQAEWSVIDKIDDFTDEEVKAVVYDDLNVRLQFNIETFHMIVSNDVSASIGMMLYVTSKSGLFEPNSILELRVDKQKVHAFEETLDDFIPKLYEWSPSTIAVLTVGATKDQTSCSIVSDILKGSELKGRYYVSKTGRQTFSISLEGATEAFQQVFPERASNYLECVPSKSTLERLQSSSQEERTRASRKIYEEGVDDKSLYEEVAIAIRKQIPTLNKKSPRAQQQEVAWHIKALSCSGNQKFLPLFDELVKSPARTVAKYAKKYKKLLAESAPCK